MNFTPAGSTPNAPAEQPGVTPAARPIARYVPARQSLGMSGNTAPIQGVPQQAPAPQIAANTDSEEAANGDVEIEHDSETSRRLSIVARKDRKAREQIQAARAAENEVRQRVAALEERERALTDQEKVRAAWRTNPRKLLEDNGFTPEAALQYMLNGEKLTPDQQLALTVDQKLAEAQRATDERLDQMRLDQEQEDRRRQAEEAEAEKREQAEAEESAMEELRGDIGEIVAQDSKAFPLVRKAGQRGIAAVLAHVSDLSDQEYRRTGRRPPTTTKMLERAAKEIEAAAKKEQLELLNDPDFIASLGADAPFRPPVRTLTNRGAPAASPQIPAQQGETPAQHRARVVQYLDSVLKRR